MTAALSTAKGPAEVAASPSRGSLNPRKDPEMNAHRPITPEPVTATKSKALPEISVSIARLASLSMSDAYDLRSALQTVIDVISGLMCQPRFMDDSHQYTPSALVLDDVSDFLMRLEGRLVDVVKVAKPTDAREIEKKAWILLQHECQWADGLVDFAALAAAGARDAEHARHDALVAARKATRGDGKS